MAHSVQPKTVPSHLNKYVRIFGISDDAGTYTYRVGLRARRTFQLRLSSLRTKPALGNALLLRFSQLQLRCSTSNSGTSPQASSPRSELSAKWAAKNVIDFCRADRNLSSTSLARYFQSKKRKSKVVRRRRRRKKKKTRSTCGGR